MIRGAQLVLRNEREIRDSTLKNFENHLKEKERIDKRIASELCDYPIVVDKIEKIPYVGRTIKGVLLSKPVKPLIRKIKRNVISAQPLPTLEYALRKAINDTLLSIAEIGNYSRYEKDRIQRFMDTYEQAVKDDWGPAEFINFIDENTEGIEFIVKMGVDKEGNDIKLDMKDFIFEAYSVQSPKRVKEKKKEYLEWFNQHINLSKQYYKSMEALTLVASEWVGGMLKSYADITFLRGGMEKTELALRITGQGGRASISTQTAIREYGTAYVKGMNDLLDGYNKMCDLKDQGSDEFEKTLNELQRKLEGRTSHVDGIIHRETKKIGYRKDFK